MDTPILSETFQEMGWKQLLNLKILRKFQFFGVDGEKVFFKHCSIKTDSKLFCKKIWQLDEK